jgi:hypothetical protein
MPCSPVIKLSTLRFLLGVVAHEDMDLPKIRRGFPTYGIS